MQFRTVVFGVPQRRGSHKAMSLNYWFYSLVAITSFVGIGNLVNVREVQFAFSLCHGVTEFDFSGFDSSYLMNLYYCFAGCNALTTTCVEFT